MGTLLISAFLLGNSFAQQNQQPGQYRQYSKSDLLGVQPDPARVAQAKDNAYNAASNYQANGQQQGGNIGNNINRDNFQNPTSGNGDIINNINRANNFQGSENFDLDGDNGFGLIDGDLTSPQPYQQEDFYQPTPQIKSSTGTPQAQQQQFQESYQNQYHPGDNNLQRQSVGNQHYYMDPTTGEFHPVAVPHGYYIMDPNTGQLVYQIGSFEQQATEGNVGSIGANNRDYSISDLQNAQVGTGNNLKVSYYHINKNKNQDNRARGEYENFIILKY